MGGPNDATTNLHIMAYQYSFQWYQMGKGMAQAIVLLLLVVIVSYLLMRLWNRAVGEHEHDGLAGRILWQRPCRANVAIAVAAACCSSGPSFRSSGSC